MIFALGGFHAKRRTKIGRADLGNHFLLGPDRNLIVIFVQRLAIEPRPVAGAVNGLMGKRRIKGVAAGEAVERRHGDAIALRSEEHTSELQSIMRNSYAVFCLKKKNTRKQQSQHNNTNT